MGERNQVYLSPPPPTPLSSSSSLSLHHQHGRPAVVAAVVGHAPQEKLLDLGLGVRGHDQSYGVKVCSFPADDAANRVCVDFGLHQMDDGVGADRQKAREEALGDKVLCVLDELLVGVRVLVFGWLGGGKRREKGGRKGL